MTIDFTWLIAIVVALVGVVVAFFLGKKKGKDDEYLRHIIDNANKRVRKNKKVLKVDEETKDKLRELKKKQDRLREEAHRADKEHEETSEDINDANSLIDLEAIRNKLPPME